MTYSKPLRHSSLLLVLLLLQVAPLLPGPALSARRGPISQNHHGFAMLGSNIRQEAGSRRKSAFLRPPPGLESRAPGARARPARKGLPMHALHRGSAPTNGNGPPPAAGNIFGRLWSSVKRLFGGGEETAKVPMVTSLTRLPATHLPRMMPMQALRSFQSLNLPVTLPSGDLNPAAQGGEASPYTQLIRAQPSMVMTKFLERASQRVRDAAKSIVGALVGSFYRYCIETTMITTSERLSVLIHSMQMTGYMLWNAECRYCLSQQLLGEPEAKEQQEQQQQSPSPPLPPSQSTEAEAEPDAKGKPISIIPQLRDELVPPCNTDSLLWYIKKLPDDTANALFDNMTTGVLEAMHESTDVTVESLAGVAMHQQPPGAGVPPRLLLQQTGSSCIQLCFWHLALGYCLRDQEAKIELQNALQGT